MSSIISHGRRCFKSDLWQSKVVERILAPQRIERRCREAGHRWRRSFWSPPATLLTFLLQAANPAKSLRAAVADLLAHLLRGGAGAGADARDGALPSADPSAFAQARRRLPMEVIERTFHAAAREVGMLAGQDDRWCGFRVIVIDGLSLSMPDTPELQKMFPQHGQMPGCGFPQANLVALFDWRSGAAIDCRMGSRRDGEPALLRKMLDHFGPGTVALADRCYCSYTDIARLVARGADAVFRLHQRRCRDFRRGYRLSSGDCLVNWRRPAQWRPSFGVSREEFDRLPAEMTLRLVRTRKAPRGFRSREIVIVTTILDPREASGDQLLALYRDRWLAELNIRCLKTTMGMEVLRGKSVDVVRKEVLVHLLLYNLIRLLMWEAALAAGRDPQRVSFAGTLHRLRILAASVLSPARTRRPAHDALLPTLLDWIALDIVPHRPDRFEPRRVKRRPKNYSRLTRPRTYYHTHGDPSCR